MPASEPVLTVLLYSSLAAALAGLGALPFVGGRHPSQAWVGGAYALASGLMLGAGHLLVSHGLERAGLSVILGAALGVLYTYWIKAYSGTQELDRRPGGQAPPDEGYKIILESMLHAASEGVAIGVAMVLEVKLGVFVALALAIHNIGEAMALTDLFRRRGMTTGEAAGLCVATNVPQPLLALATFALSPVLAGFLPAALGFAAGALVLLVLTELLPASYQRVRGALVAAVVSATAGVVLLLEDFFV